MRTLSQSPRSTPETGWAFKPNTLSWEKEATRKKRDFNHGIQIQIEEPKYQVSISPDNGIANIDVVYRNIQLQNTVDMERHV